MDSPIIKSEVPELMLSACPSYRPIWDSSHDYNVDDDGDRLYYVDAGDMSRHLVALLAEGETSEFHAVFALIERLHIEGDDYVRELASIGYLEGIQFAASHEDRVEEDKFVPFLGPESLRWWKGLVGFWSGEIPGPVQPLDD